MKTPLFLRRAKVDERDHLILLVVWETYRERGGTTYAELVAKTGLSQGALANRVRGYHHSPGKERTSRRQGGGLVERGLLRVAPSLGRVILPGPCLAMYRRSIPYELVGGWYA